MANNRLFLVDTTTREYLCLAKGWGYGWQVGNLDLYQEFLASRASHEKTTQLLMGHESDREFMEQWIHNGSNINTTNKWVYAGSEDTPCLPL